MSERLSEVPELADLSALGSETSNGRRLKASERIAARLANYIISQELPEGTRLPPEKQMAEVLGVGRATLREGLRLLETRGAITMKAGPKGGPVVRRPRPSDLGESLAFLLQFEHASLADVMVARTTLEPVLARLAVEHVTEDDLDELALTTEALKQRPNCMKTFHRENSRFHQIIATRSGNPILQAFSESLLSLADGTSVGVEYSAPRVLAVAHAHDRIISALATRDPEQAADAMRCHLDEAERYWDGHYTGFMEKPSRWLREVASSSGAT
jgi:GntR family transcriptional regulator, transcriptional repressor for pyruvate dehydrogenase complex